MQLGHLRTILLRVSGVLIQKIPLYLCCRLLQQDFLTLNLIRQSRLQPKLSTYAQMEEQHGYNSHSLAPPGIPVLIHQESNARETWASRGIEGWYLGPVMDRYQCYRVYTAKTGGEQISDTV